MNHRLYFISSYLEYVNIDKIYGEYAIRIAASPIENVDGTFPDGAAKGTPSLILGFSNSSGGTQLLLARTNKSLWIRYKNYNDSSWRSWREI